MKNKFKLFSLLSGAIFVLAITACGTNDQPATYENNPPSTPVENEVVESGSKVNVALIAHSPDSILDDQSFNQGAWDGITRFGRTHGLVADETMRFFQPHAASDEARLDLIEEAINTGANILVLPGFHFESALYDAQDLFPDTKFILLDATPSRVEMDGDERIVHTRIEPNVAAIHYAEEEAGFLAGYAAVMEGYRNLGFMGGIAVPAVVRFGHGFIQGADYAAAALELSEGDVTIEFMYLGAFAPNPEFQTTAASWYELMDVEVIFVAAGGAGSMIKAAAEASGRSVIGVDVDQSGLSNQVITSAVKGLDVSVYDLLTDFHNDNWNGGREIRFNAAVDGVGLPKHNSRFQNFTQEQYDTIFERLAKNDIRVNDSLLRDNIETNLVTVNEHN